MPVISLRDGRRLAWREAGIGPPLILLHGWAMSSAVFIELSARLASSYRMLAPDLRGHGDSDAGDGYTQAELAGDLAEWFDALDLREAALLGWSLGGQVALTLCPAVADRLRRLMLVATTPRFTVADDWPHGLPDGRVRVMARNLKKAPRLTVEDFWHSQFAAGESPLPPTGMLTEAERGFKPLLATLDSLRLGDLRPNIGSIDLPSLVLQGGADTITLPAAGEYLAEHLPKGKLVAWEGVGHAPFLTETERCTQLIREFLS